MDNSNQANQAEPTIEEIKAWDEEDLLKWIQQRYPKLLKDDDLTKLKRERVDGVVFLNHGGDQKYFREECNLASGTSERLANLAKETAGMVQEQATSTEHTTDRRTTKRKSPPCADTAPSPKRTRVGNSSLVINGELEYFQSGLDENFSQFLKKQGQAYFDRTRYIFKLHKLHTSILFCRPRRFGKSLTVSMLEHFHGLEYAGEHQSLYKGLDVQKDIDEKKVIPGQYFVLKFDFSEINPRPGLTEADETLIKFLNSSIAMFYETYAAYLGGNVLELCRKIDNEDPNLSLRWCARSVRKAIDQDERLAGLQGIYMLIDEYDAFPNNYLEPQETAGGRRIAWDDTAVGRTFKSFWSTIKALGRDGFIRRIFITGISPLSLSSVGSGFNVARNLSFDVDLTGLCGLTYSDLEDALERIYKAPEASNDPETDDEFGVCDPRVYTALAQMTQCFNGYHFCNERTVETVYNTETCLAYLQRLIEGKTPEVQNPENSEISEHFLQRFAASASAIRYFEKALEFDEHGHYAALEYDEFKPEFTLQDLNKLEDPSSWRSLIIYFGGLTFHPKQPSTHLKIPNSVAARRIALMVLGRYNLRHSLKEALQHLMDSGELERTLNVYRELMMQRCINNRALMETTETDHRDCFYFCLLQNHHLVPRAEFKVIKPDNTNGFVDLVLQVPGRLIVTEWKSYRIQYLNVQGGDPHRYVVNADILRDYKLPDILQLRFHPRDKHHAGTIESWVKENEGQQLRDYVTSSTVKELLEEGSLKLHAHLVIIVGSRHILVWDMDKDGTLAREPRLARGAK